MTVPSDPNQPTYRDDSGLDQSERLEPTVTDPVEALPPDYVEAPPPEPAPGPTPTPVQTQPTSESKEQGGGSKLKAAAVLAGAAALANKVRQEAPKKAREMRERRVAGRAVILLEEAGRQIAIGPYRDGKAARQASTTAAGAATVIELVSPTGYFGPQDSDSTASAPENI
jgi:hypothetical protein